MKRTLTLSITLDIEDDEVLADYVVPALTEYCIAVQVGDAGRDDEETYEAQNGVEIEAVHSTEED